MSELENQKPSHITKRNGTVVEFDGSKITNAINKAFTAVDKPNPEAAEQLSKKVIEKLLKMGLTSPTVEDIQDTVESTLIDNGFSDVAKSYIVYRYERRKLRDEKKRLLGTQNLDPVAKKFDIQCLKVLASRYLFKNSKGEIVEQPAQLFERVATLFGVADILYHNSIFSLDGVHNGVETDRRISEAKSYLQKLDNFDNKFHIGDYYLNKYHFRALVNHYITLAKSGHMKIGFREVLQMIASGQLKQYEDKISEYFNLMVSQDFLPNTPTLMNAGGRLGQLSACFVLDVPDDMSGIMKSARDAAMIFQSGGGVGINYSDLRPEGDIVASTSGVASGPTSFMEIINTVTEVVKQGGKRRGANMGILEVWHPDIEKFITNKTKSGVLENFNVSVGVWEDFWNAVVESDTGNYKLRNPRTNKTVREINAHELINLIAHSAWKSAEPGLIFFDNINRYNVFAPARGGPLRATNPCGEQSLYPYESCNLGSINLANFVKRDANGSYEFDWQRFEEVVRKTTRMLDNIIDVNLYPVDEIDKASKESRRIGLGVMGVADLLYKLRIPYNSKEGYEIQSNIAEALSYLSMDESVAIARSRGVFPLYPKTEYPEGKIPIAGYYEKPKELRRFDWDGLIDQIKQHGIRNVLTTTVAPTGTLSMLADCSSGMEPIFSLVFEKHVTVGKFFYTNKILEQTLKENNLYSDEILEKINNNYGSLKGIPEIPEWMQKVFVTAMDMHWADHLLAQGVWQDWIGNAIAKTINMPHDATADDVKAAYLLAHELGLKGITVYRDGSRDKQVLHMKNKEARKNFEVVPSDVVHSVISGYTNPYLKSTLLQSISRTSIETPEIDDESVSEEPEVRTKEIDKDKLCPTCSTELTFSEGCCVCVGCGYSGCSSS